MSVTVFVSVSVSLSVSVSVSAYMSVSVSLSVSVYICPRIDARDHVRAFVHELYACTHTYIHNMH